VSLYENYERIRDAKGLTNYRVAIAADISQSILSDWKTGKKTPTITTLVKVAGALGVQLPDLLRSSP
jgi:transcriptional regulator with XRE-family HTH domain